MNIAFQPELRPVLPCVFDSEDYHDFRGILFEVVQRVLAPAAEPSLSLFKKHAILGKILYKSRSSKKRLTQILNKC